jgi:hypothetical protein
MKFLVPNYSCLQNPWLGGYRPPDPRSLCLLSPTEFVEPPPPEKNSWVRHCSALEGCEGSASRPGRNLRPGKTRYPLQEAGWASGPVWTGAENLSPTGIRSPDRPARRLSLYRLSYPGPRRCISILLSALVACTRTDCLYVSYSKGRHDPRTVPSRAVRTSRHKVYIYCFSLFTNYGPLLTRPLPITRYHTRNIKNNWKSLLKPRINISCWSKFQPLCKTVNGCISKPS